MKRTIRAAAFCFALLAAGGFFLLHTNAAKEDPIAALLKMPAPPPPNPLVPNVRSRRYGYVRSSTKAPDDNAPIEELLDYWRTQNDARRKLFYSPEPSDNSRERIIKEIDKNPDLLTHYLHSLEGDAKAADFVKELYDREGIGGVYDRDERREIKRWLTYNSPYFSNDLAQVAQKIGDNDLGYVSSQDELLALARFDFDKAQPILNHLYNDSTQRVSQVLAKWALYRHALDTGSTGDIERYRDELKSVVEDRSLPGPMRDLAMDGLVSEKEWPERDDWYTSLLGDPTLAYIEGYTGLTTLIDVSPEGKYTEKMLELIKSNNPTIRGVAIRNLALSFGREANPDVLRALLPWLEDPYWAVDAGGTRYAMVMALTQVEIPESVPGLIKMLDEKPPQRSPGPAANRPVRIPSNTMAPANRAANSSLDVTPGEYYPPEEPFPFRSQAIRALAAQKDVRAVPALRRVLNETNGYERAGIVGAMLACGGFSVAEQMDALEDAAKGVQIQMDNEEAAAANPVANTVPYPVYGGRATNTTVRTGSVTAAELKALLGQQLLQSKVISDPLAYALVERIDGLEGRDQRLADAFRKMILRWQNPVINALLLRDVKRGRADADSILRLLAQRKDLREKQPNEVSDIKTGKPAAVGIGACLTEDAIEYDTLLDSPDAEAKTALLACARLIRASLPVQKVAAGLKSENKMLATAAERYLESEDSPEAQSIVLSLHKNEAKILGATTAFFSENKSTYAPFLASLFQSVKGDMPEVGGEYDPDFAYTVGNNDPEQRLEKQLQAEVIKDPELLGIYAYENNSIRIFNDRAIYSWQEDASRYRERPLSKFEFDTLKTYLTTNKVGELPPFLSACSGDAVAEGPACNGPRELVMVGRQGGRRIFMTGRITEFFAGLDKYFDELRQTKGTLKYTLSKELPGLEIILADDDMHAETLWKNGDDLRVLVSSHAIRKKVDAEIEKAGEDESDDAPAVMDAESYPRIEEAKSKLRDQREYEGYEWHKVAAGSLGEATTQPAGVEYIALRDSASVQSTQEQWKARAGDFELRSDPKGLYKVTRGRLLKLQDGNFQDLVITPNGRWAVATRSTEDDSHLVRLNLLTNKAKSVEFEKYSSYSASSYIPTINKVLLKLDEGDGEGDEAVSDDDQVADDPSPQSLLLLDPDTGAQIPANGEYRPLTQQTFRPLQKASKPNEFWAAMPDSEKNETVVGIYDINHFGFRTVLRIPKIRFNSMDMWVDEPARKVYFVYRGHVLALPLNL